MAITPTGAIFKSLVFDGEDSRDYGIYITGEAVFNAPTRDAEAIVIPGRNGTFIRDNGRFDNIPGTYSCGCYADTEADFAEAISAFRNMLCSRVGYKRLEDDYNPAEFRQAVYKSGLEVTPSLLKAGEFSITFECKPQRFLKSGETAQAVTNGATLTNPTLFEAKPMIEVEGYGRIIIDDQVISIFQTPIGEVTLWQSEKRTAAASSSTVSFAKSFDGSLMATSDELTLASASFEYSISGSPSAMGISAHSGFDTASTNESRRVWSLGFINPTFTKGTSATKTGTATLTATVGSLSITQNVTCSLAYDGNQTITLTMTGGRTIQPRIAPSATFGVLTGDSSVNVSDPMFIDCENGLAWWDVSGTIVDANNAVELPASLPVLNPAANVINFDNTLTSVKIAPRWWII